MDIRLGFSFGIVSTTGSGFSMDFDFKERWLVFQGLDQVCHVGSIEFYADR
jgi:hypothetical protein